MTLPYVATGAQSDARLAGINWPGHGNDSREQRFSSLAEINDKNVGRLGLAWSLDLPGELLSLEATPIEVGGIIFFSGSFADVYAVDARTGRLIWKYEARANETWPQGARLNWGVNRGVAYWGGMVYVATRDCRMIAINAKTGKAVWTSSFAIPGYPTTSTGAPRIFNGKVIIGNSGAETGTRGAVTAFDARTGALAWRFFTVPGDPAKGFENEAMAMAAKTWSGQWWKYGGGGTPWNGITFDEELNQVYIGTGNGGPWNPRYRSKEGQSNLFVASVVALDADTGKYKWHYQYNPREAWDYKATADMILADLTIAGVHRKVLMQAPSNGFFYVIDRTNGKVISAEKIGKVTWAKSIDLKTGLPVEEPGIRYENAPSLMYPNNIGAHNWQASSYNPATGLVYIPYQQEGGSLFSPSLTAEEELQSDLKRLKVRLGASLRPVRDPKDPMDGKGSLLAWDPAAQKLRWRVDYPYFYNAGTMTTAGNLVFQGTNTGQFYAYNATTGARLWSFDAKLGIIAPPITYAVGGRQYVSLLVGYGGTGFEGGEGRDLGFKYGLQTRRLLTFAISATAELPPTAPPNFTVRALDDPSIKLDPAKVALGQKTYGVMNCGVCHGGAVRSSGGAPDLRESATALDRAAFATVLRDGVLAAAGMPRFDDLTPDELEGLYQYIRSEARNTMAGQGPSSPVIRSGL